MGANLSGATDHNDRAVCCRRPNDGIARIMAERMSVSLGQPVTVENIDGAAGSIGTRRAARAAPDGYTISIGYWGTHVANAAIYPLDYDVVKDFAPITLLVEVLY